MNDMGKVVEPRSDQYNYDDFQAGALTFTIDGVRVRGGQEQPVEMTLAGTTKFYRPCKSMCRVMIAAWGPDSSKYAGKSLTLYGDASIKWGGMAVGGIRISHMSHIDSAMTMALTATKGSRKPFTVRPLAVATPAATKPAPRPAPLSEPAPPPPAQIQDDGAGHTVELLTFEQGLALGQALEDKLIPTAKLLAAAEKVTGEVYLTLSQLPASFYDRAVDWVGKQASLRPTKG